MPPGEARARARLAARAEQPPSLLERLMRDVVRDGRAWISFDDLAGLVERVPDLRLPIDLLMHSGPLCMAAKADPRSHAACARNKHAVNRLVLRRGAGLVGRCHLGLTDAVEPLVVRDRVLGVFYCGSVSTPGAPVGARVEAHVHRVGVEAGALERALAQVPRAGDDEVAALRARLRTVVDATARVVEAWGAPVARGGVTVSSRVWHDPTPLPAPLARALDRLRASYDQPVQLGAIAAELGVTADHLGRLFRQHIGQTFPAFVTALRVDRAQRLLDSGLSASEVAHRTGFADQAHLGRAFKRLTGTTPARWARRQP